MKSQTIFVFLLSIVFTLVNEIAGEPPVTYLGCFEDGGPSNRLMTGLHENFHGSLTPDKCNEHCRGKGFAYAGTQYSYECFCSRTKPPEGKKSLESDCNSKCAGDETKNCGGTNRLAIFTTGFPDQTGGEGEGLVSLGCFKDSDKNRVLAEYRQDFPGALTNQKCVRLCTKRGYRYAGTEYGRECYCGNKTPSFKQYANDEECSKRCEGDVNQLCGGGWRIFVFKTSNGDQQGPLEAGKYVGCFKDQESPRNLDGHMEDFGSFLTHFKCTGLCYSKGFLYAGTQFSSQCFCGDKPPSPISKTADSECNKPCSGNKAETCGGDWRNSIRETGIPDAPVEGKYLGCFNDLNNQIYGDVKLTFEKANSPRRCMNYCSQLGYKFSGVEYGKECFCGHKEPSTELVVNPEECNMACPGDSEESCGSGWRLAVYTTGTGGNVITNRFKVTTPKPCLPTETIVSGKEVCKGDVIFEDHFNTPLGNTWSHIVMIPDDPSSRLDSNGNPRARNINNKRKRHIKYPNKESSAVHEYSSAIPESSSVAHESSSAIPESSSVAHESSSAIHESSSAIPESSSAIPESSSAIHESSSAIPESASVIHESVEFLGVFVVKPTYTDENTYFGETVVSRIKDLSCSNQVLARNRINSILMELEQEELKNVHKRVKGLEESDDHSSNCPEAAADHATSSMPQDNNAEEFEYAVFTAKPENSFTRKNKLIIKPTFHDDTFIQTGFLHLDGCTGREGSRQCELQAASYNIIPPLATARINTRNSFNFRYGIVEIRAKLPVGDWLVPELWLEPRNHFYGPGYASGRIRIAMNRGNADFKCQGEDYGWNRLESGVVMGSSDNVQKRSLTTKLPANWHDNFHNYTLIWSPDSIAFRIDNGQAQELIPAGQRLCETIGFQGEQCLIWNPGSRIAPFDKDFYISLGLSVGNNRDFPDGCTNRGQPKPWKNGDLKATLKFWLDKENWKATWTEENSSLQIEHIRVTAL